MHEEYFDMEHIHTFDAGFWFMLKLRIFGKKIQERAGRYTATWYAYKGKLYITEYSEF